MSRITLIKASAMPVGVVLMLASCALTINYVMRGATIPELSSGLIFSMASIVFASRIAGGCAVTAAQIFGLIVYRLANERMMHLLYWAATLVSIYISICTLHSSFIFDAQQSKYNSREYQELLKERARVIKAIRSTGSERDRMVDFYFARSMARRANELSEEYQVKIDLIEKKLAVIDAKIESIARSGVTENSAPASSYIIPVVVAILIDLTGTYMLAFSIGYTKIEKSEPLCTSIAPSVYEVGSDGKPMTITVHKDKSLRTSNNIKIAYPCEREKTKILESVEKSEFDDIEGEISVHQLEISNSEESEGVEAEDAWVAPGYKNDEEIISAYNMRKVYGDVFRMTEIKKGTKSLQFIKEVLYRNGINHEDENN